MPMCAWTRRYMGTFLHQKELGISAAGIRSCTKLREYELLSEPLNLIWKANATCVMHVIILWPAGVLIPSMAADDSLSPTQQLRLCRLACNICYPNLRDKLCFIIARDPRCKWQNQWLVQRHRSSTSQKFNKKGTS